jgi:hypothetical protein
MPIDFIRVSIQGTSPTSEVWSINPIYAFGDFDQPTPDFEDMQAAAQAAADVTPGTDLRSVMGLPLALTGARLEGRTLNGDLQVVGEATRTTPLAGTGSASKPYQTAVVFSLRTANPGARGRGRLYWPAIGASMEATNLRWTAAQQGLALTAMVTYLKAIGTAIATPLGFPAGTLNVWSRAGLALHQVNVMAAGDVFDTQRRRRDRAVESYVSAPY